MSTAMRFAAVVSRAGFARLACMLIAAGALLSSPHAHAVPSFARQTGLACAACHTVFPELTPFGRQFKLSAYVIDNLKTIRDISTQKEDILELNEIPPLSVMFQVSYTEIGKAIPDSSGVAGDYSQNGSVLFPQQASLFYAGKIASKVGAFAQVTYEQPDDHFTWDNTDIRFADNLSTQKRDLIWGASLNNNPTVQDPWNSTPAWGFPYSSSSVAPTPAASPLLDGTLAQQVAGLTVYAWWRNSLYGEIGGYRSAQTGQPAPLDSAASNVISGGAPYWRFAYEHQWDRNAFEVGTYGLRANVFPGGGLPLSGATNRFTDTALDAQYQFIGDRHIVTVLGTYIHENRDLNASYGAGAAANSSTNLNTFKLAGSYYYQRRYGGSLAYFRTTGSTDTLLYQPGPVDGSSNGSPDSDGFIVSLEYLPWLNTKFSLQYVAYNKFNGGSSNYDGYGRDASDNNTLYLLAWFNF